MRTIFILSVSALVFLVACEVEQTPAELFHKQTVAVWFQKGWSQGDMTVFDPTIAESVVFHYGDASREIPLDEMKGMVNQWREAFPDLQVDVESLIAEGEMVAARLTLSGTHEGPWAGAEATGNTITLPVMMFFRFEQGHLVELWEVSDQLAFQRQLGLIPEPD